MMRFPQRLFVALLMLSKVSQRYPKMKSKQGLITALVGIAMIAMPIAAKADDHGRHWKSGYEARAIEQARLTGMPVTAVGRHGQLIASAPIANGPAGWGFNRHDNGKHLGWYHNRGLAANSGVGSGYVCDRDGDDCRPAGYGYQGAGYGYQGAGYGYQAPIAPAYPMPAAYQTPYYGSGYGAPVMAPIFGGAGSQMSSAKAQAKAQYAAALQSHNRSAIRSAQQNLNAINRQIARTNVRTTGAPYAGYGSNLSQQPLHKRLLNGLLGGNAYNATPAYGNALAYNNYNNGALPGVAAYQNQGYGAAPVAPGYGSPYAGGGSMLAPLLGSFIH
jgi:hypothetical protein